MVYKVWPLVAWEFQPQLHYSRWGYFFNAWAFREASRSLLFWNYPFGCILSDEEIVFSIFFQLIF